MLNARRTMEPSSSSLDSSLTTRDALFDKRAIRPVQVDV